MENEAFDACMERMARCNDQGALEEIYRQYHSYVYYSAYSLLGHREDAEDVSSRVFIKLWEGRRQYRPGGGHKAYISTITRNLCIDDLRQKQREVPAEKEEMEGYAGAGEGGMGDVELKEAVEKALSYLSAEQREVFHMKVMGELSFKEISQVLGIPLATAAWRYQKAQKILKGVWAR